jgi:hypothetical protein
MRFYPRDKLRQFTERGATTKLLALGVVFAIIVVLYWVW